MLLEAVPNLSLGPEDPVLDVVLERVEAAQGPGVGLLDVHTDPDHARTVLTLAGAPVPLGRALAALVDAVEDEATLEGHQGVHPRVGLVDVVPLVRLDGAREADADRAARRVAGRLARAGVPSFFYARMATRPEHEALAGIRRRVEFTGGADPLDPAPDVGPPSFHERLGAACVGVRDPLVAYNVVLDTTDLDAGFAIARRLRPANGGLEGVQALAFPLASRGGRMQVSTNITDVDATTTGDVYTFVAEQARERGIDVLEGELVGLAPERALPASGPAMGLDERPQPLEAHLDERGFPARVP